MSLTELSAFVEGLLIEHGYIALFGIFVLEGAMLLYFAPSESLVPGAIYLLTSHSPFEIAVVIGVAAVGATVGQTALFLFAKRGGRDRLFEHRWIRVSEDRLDRFDRWFDRWGMLSVVLSNTLPFTRGMCTIPAGFARLDTHRFVVSSALGTVVFESALALVTIGVLQLF
ncbi:DedA family protein [Halocatena salina]|uniref:VTT domain-containing protein n=1 Tax=Halocatena salina TaxID=2934340 RepID=A0A8U0A6L5_9EURY|nr:VTT domain-containing protein [Halocatena salina]UPM43593.1 VTT domain-containing protein [Halocatena salina]